MALFKKEVKQEDNTDLFSSQISGISRRLMLVESRIKTISNEQNEISKTIFERTNALEKQLDALTEQIKTQKIKIELLQQKQKYLEKYLQILAPKTDMMVLKEKIDLLNPLYLMSKPEVEALIDKKLSKYQNTPKK